MRVPGIKEGRKVLEGRGRNCIHQAPTMNQAPRKEGDGEQEMEGWNYLDVEE